MGRLFDAVAALCGVRTEVTYEGQAAVELEAVADRSERGAYPLDVAAGVLDARPTVLAVADDVAAGVEPAVVAARFHRAVARATAQACAEVAGARGLDTVVLAGGVWQNRLLLELTLALLRDAGLRVLVPERLPPNDGAISLRPGGGGRARSARRRADEGDEVVDQRARGPDGEPHHVPRARRRRRIDRDDAEQAGVDVRRHRIGRQERDPQADPGRLADRAVGADGQRLAVQGVGRQELLVGRARPGVGLAQQPRAPAELRRARPAPPPASGSSAALTSTSSLGRNGRASDALVVGRAPAEGDVRARAPASESRTWPRLPTLRPRRTSGMLEPRTPA